jgi:hypothetical protein
MGQDGDTPEPGRPPDRADAQRQRRAREVFVLGVSILILAVAGGARLRSRAMSGAVSVAPALPPGPLPSGAEERAPAPMPDESIGIGCHFEERGFGDYERWRPLGLGRLLVPGNGRALHDDGSFHLLIHFHGAEPIRKQLAPEGADLVIAGLDLGLGSGVYDRAFSDPAKFETLVAEVEREVAGAAGRSEARASRIAVSSWSAGYGAVAHILARRRDRLGAVVLLDSLHAGYAQGKRSLEHGQLAPFVAAARAAAEGGPLFYLTHSAIVTDDYASTSETADFVLRELGVHAQFVPTEPSDKVQLEWSYEKNQLFVRGYSGADKDAHCEQLRLLLPIVRDHVLGALGR